MLKSQTRGLRQAGAQVFREVGAGQGVLKHQAGEVWGSGGGRCLPLLLPRPQWLLGATLDIKPSTPGLRP